jgi:hypothetical protein
MNLPPNNNTIFPRSKWWWLAVGLLLLLAAWLYLRGYNVSLPYLEHVDEPQHLLAAQHLIDDGTARAVFQDIAPPGMSRLNYILLRHVKPDGAPPGVMLPALRLITIAVWMLLVVLIALLGHMLCHPVTGLMAAAIWIVNPWVVERAHFALPDGYLTFFTLLALWLALVAVHRSRRGCSAAAMYFIMLATIFKTQAIFVAPLILIMPLLGKREPGFRWSDAGKDIFWNAVRLAVFLFWLLLLYPTLEISDIPHIPVQISEGGLPRPRTIWSNLSQVLLTFQPIGVWLGAMVIAIGLWRYRHRLNAIALAGIILAALAWLLGISAFGPQALRQFFTLGALLSLLYALSLSGLVFLLQDALTRLVPARRFHLMLRQASALPTVVVASLLAVSLLPSYQKSNALAHNFTLHDRRNDLMRYMDTSLPPGRYIATDENHKTFNRAWGGYDGEHDFPLARVVRNLTEESLDSWRDLEADYAILPYSDDPDAYFPGETVSLKRYPPDPGFRGPSMVVLRLYPMQHEAKGQLGSIHLVGYDLSAREAIAGDEIIIRHYWRADSPTDSIHYVFNHVINEAGEIATQTDYVPLWDDRRPTTTWDDPDETMLGRAFTLSLPPDLPAGSYRLLSGLYNPASGQRLAAADGADYIDIAQITVMQPEA